jgi:hypothetical protein
MREFDATIFTIATGKYLDYFALQLPQIAKHYAPGRSVQVIVATDRKDRLPVSEDARIAVQFVESPAYGWPEITLLRYEQILAHKDLIKGGTLMWLDTDMEFLSDIPLEVIAGKGDAPNYARHPGFVWSSSKASWFNPIVLARQVAPWVRGYCLGQRGAGTWETNSTSKAYVPANNRRTYAHGAVWGGVTELVLEMVELLAKRTREDYEVGKVAVWHDESHLNWYVANYKVNAYPLGFSAWKKTWQYDATNSFFNSLDKSELDAKLAGQANSQ